MRFIINRVIINFKRFILTFFFNLLKITAKFNNIIITFYNFTLNKYIFF